ncbi:MAG: hypothetical protein LBU80_01360 [Rikenellaceae bacterium]|nr:hypothetical protein [Rikenellaceae bacterium]
MPREEMPARLRQNILEQAEACENTHRAIRTNVRDLLFASAGALGLLVVPVAVLYSGYGISLVGLVRGLDFSVFREIDFSGYLPWISICGCALLLLMADTLILRRFRQRMVEEKQ